MSQKINDAVSISQSDMPHVFELFNDKLEWALKNIGHSRGLTTPLFLSMPWAGKTETGNAMAKAMGRLDYDARAGNFMPMDIRIPTVDKENNTCSYAGNTELPFVTANGPITPDSRVLLKWDEFLDASLAVMRIMKQAMNDGCVGNQRFPENTLQVAFANGLQHGCQSEALPLSSANRMAIYEIEPSVEGFQEHLASHGLFPELEAVVHSNIDIFYDIDVPTWDGRSNFASFRSVTEVGIHLNQFVEVDEHTGERMLHADRDRLLSANLNALVGYKAGKKIETAIQIIQSVGSIQNLLDDPTGAKIPSDPSMKWVVACKLTGMANEENVEACLKVASRLMGEKSFMESYVGKCIAKQKPALNFHPALAKWRGDNVLELCGRE